jgi:hypothetical protein
MPSRRMARYAFSATTMSFSTDPSFSSTTASRSVVVLMVSQVRAVLFASNSDMMQPMSKHYELVQLAETPAAVVMSS